MPLDFLSSHISERYQHFRPIAQGGMGLLLSARDVRTGRPVAIKILATSLAGPPPATVRARFLREARTLARLSHPYIVEVLDVGDDDVMPFFVMEMVEGTTLAAHLAGLERPDLAAHLHICLDVCDALAHAHEKGVVHRDVKPDNVVLLPSGGVKVLDFGLARVDDEQTYLTRTGEIMGTPGYMAPEQLAGQRVDHRADIYSVGCLLYELLTLEQPFPAESFALKLERAPRPPSEHNPDVSSRLDTLVLQALSISPDDRPSTMRELKGAVSSCLRDYETFADVPLLSANWKDVLRTDLERLAAFAAPPVERVVLAPGTVREVVILRLGLAVAASPGCATPPEENLTFVRDRALCLLGEDVERYGGVVDRFESAGLVACFGSHATTEQDSARAASAGLAVVQKMERIERMLACRGLLCEVGLEIDLARVTVDDEDLDRSAFSILAPGRAAPPPGLWATEPVAARLRADFRLGAVHPATGLVSVEGRSRKAGDPTMRRFVGRQAELARLRALIPGAGDTNSTLVLVRGEPGLGKSALVRHFIGSLGGRILSGTATSYPGTPYEVVLQIVQSLLGVDESFTTAGVMAALTTTVDRLRRSSDGRGATDRPLETESVRLAETDPIPALKSLLGVATERAVSPDAQIQRDAISQAMSHLISLAAVEARAAGGPMVLVLDNMQWMDELSTQILEVLLGTAKAPLHVVATARPPYEPPERLKRHGTYAAIDLAPLSLEESQDLLRSHRLPPGDGEPRRSLSDVEVRTLSLAGGNPLFLEELTGLFVDGRGPAGQTAASRMARQGRTTRKVRALDQRPAPAIPASIQSLVTARLDALPATERELLSLCSVAGEQLDGGILEDAWERLRPGGARDLAATLVRLTELRFLTPVSHTGPQLLRFRQSLVREIVYATILPANQRTLHRLVFQALERATPPGTEPPVEAMAHHAGRAADWANALAYTRRALDRALTRHDHDAIVRLAGEALRLVVLSRPDLESISDLVGQPTGESGAAPGIDPGRTCELDEATLIASVRPDEAPAVLDVLAMREQALDTIGDREAQTADLERMLSLARSQADHERLTRVLIRWSRFWCWHGGDQSKAQESALESMGLARRIGHRLLEADALTNLACSHSVLGGHDASIRYIHRALRIYRETGNEPGAGASLCFLAINTGEVGQLAAALAQAQEALDTDRRCACLRGTGRDLRTLGTLKRMAGLYPDALADCVAALEIDRAIGYRQGQAHDLAYAGATLVETGRSQEALSHLESALTLATFSDIKILAAEIHLSLARLHSRPWEPTGDGSEVLAADPVRAGSEARAAADWGRRLGHVGIEIMGLSLEARSVLAKGEPATALALSDRAVSMLSDSRLPGADPVEICETHARVLDVHGRADQARAIRERARDYLAKRAAATGDEWLARSLLENVPLHRRMLASA